MSSRAQYTPGPASGAEIQKNGEEWTLVLVATSRILPRKPGRR